MNYYLRELQAIITIIVFVTPLLAVLLVMPLESNYPYMEAKGRELTERDVDRLLSLYKDLVAKYTRLCKAIDCLPNSEREPILRHLKMQETGSLVVSQRH